MKQNTDEKKSKRTKSTVRKTIAEPFASAKRKNKQYCESATVSLDTIKSNTQIRN